MIGTHSAKIFNSRTKVKHFGTKRLNTIQLYKTDTHISKPRKTEAVREIRIIDTFIRNRLSVLYDKEQCMKSAGGKWLIPMLVFSGCRRKYDSGA